MLAIRKNLAINKGNSVRFKVQFIDQRNNIIILDENAMVYFTVKENYSNDDYVFQKTLLDGIDFSEEDNCYIVEIEIDDTENLEYKDYVYDISFTRNEGLGSANEKEKTTALIGNFTIGHGASFEQNEIREEVSA